MSTRWSSSLTLLAAALGCTPGPKPEVLPADLPWTPFYWARVLTDSARFDRAALLIEDASTRKPVPSVLQLDFAGSGTMPEGFPPGEIWHERTGRQGHLHGLLSASEQISMYREAGPADPLSLADREVGTLGLLVYVRKTLIIDFARERLAAVALSHPVSQFGGLRVAAIPIETAGDRVVIPIQRRSGATLRALLDTGLSPFPLWTNQATWSQLTGRQPGEAGTRKYSLRSREDRLVFYGAPLREELRLGTWALDRLEVVYLSSGPRGARLEEWPNPVDAVLGASAFGGDAALLLTLANRSLRLVRTRH